jgi:predicted DNA-binding transcriptional regulator YafY
MPINKNAYLRYLTIDKLLSSKAYKRDELRKRLCVALNLKISESTLDKDIRFLKENFKAPIKTTSAGYEYTDSAFSLSSLKLSKPEQQALEFTADVLGKAGNSELIQEAQTVLNKLYRKLNSGKTDNKIISSDINLTIKGTEWLEVIYEAAKEQIGLIVDYNSPRQKKVVKHHLSPYLLKEYRSMWYVIGYSEEKGFTIVLALDRIKDILPSNVSFHIDPDFNNEKYFKHSLGITHRQYHKPEKVKFWVAKDAFYYMKVRPLHNTQKVLEETEDGYIVQLDVFLSEELLIEFMGLGSRVKVLEPAELVNRIHEEVKKMSHYYERE